MNIESVILLCVIGILFIGAVRGAKRNKAVSKCNGNCSECGLKN